MWRLGIVAAALATSACFDPARQDRTVADVSMVLGPRPVILRPEGGLRAPGPYNEVCLTLPSGSGWAWREQRVRRQDGRLVLPAATLVEADGRREPFPFVGVILGRHVEACFETRPARDLRRRYETLELSADDTLTVTGVRWDAGERAGFI